MLVLSRQLHERIILPTIPAVIEVVALKASVVRLGLKAPADVPVFREEMLHRASVPTNTPLALSAAEAETQLERITQGLRYRLHILALEFDRTRQRVGDNRDPELQRLLHNLETDIHRSEEQLKVLLLVPAEKSAGDGEVPPEPVSPFISVAVPGASR